MNRARIPKPQANERAPAPTLFYRARLPGAVFVQDRPTLAELLDYVARKVKEPIGSIYIVSQSGRRTGRREEMTSSTFPRRCKAGTALSPARAGGRIRRNAAPRLDSDMSSP